MIAAQVECGKCRVPLTLSVEQPEWAGACAACGAEIHAEIFPALLRETPRGKASESVVADEESSCFYHPTKKAAVPCDACGRFLCSVCSIEMEGRQLCAPCIESGAAKGNLPRLKREHVHYDEVALVVAILPALFIWPTLVTAPIAIYLVLRHWRRPLSAGPRSRWRFVVAFLVAVTQLVAWAVGFGEALL